MASDPTPQEQDNVRTALRFLRVRSGNWANVGKAIRCGASTLRNVVAKRAASASLAVRVARFAKVSVDDLLAQLPR